MRRSSKLPNAYLVVRDSLKAYLPSFFMSGLKSCVGLSSSITGWSKSA